MAIDVKTATEKATEYLKLFYPECKKILIEEVQLLEEEGIWSVTFSFIVDETGYTLLVSTIPRKLKTFRIDASTGNFLSMKTKESY